MGLEVVMYMKITKPLAFGYLELVMQQVRTIYQMKHPRMRAYRNQFWDLVDNYFEDLNIIVVPIELNQKEDSFELVSRTFKLPNLPQVKYEVEMRYRPSIPNHIKYW